MDDPTAGLIRKKYSFSENFFRSKIGFPGSKKAPVFTGAPKKKKL